MKTKVLQELKERGKLHLFSDRIYWGCIRKYRESHLFTSITPTPQLLADIILLNTPNQND